VNNLRDMLSVHEGREAKRYPDSEGYWTIGVGHLIDERKGGSLPTFIAIALAHRGIDVYKDEAMPEDLIDQLLDHDIAEHRKLLRRFQPWVETLDPVRQAVLDDMTFNLGIEPFDNDGFKDWPIFLSQVKSGQYEKAAVNMLSTLWARQVKSRAVRLAAMMKTGQWPKGV
jgi:lysozyme